MSAMPINDNDSLNLIFSDHQLLLVDENGEVIGMPDAPGEDSDIEDILNFISRRRPAAQAKLEGLQAEKDALIERINAQYDPLINQQKGVLNWFTARYGDILQNFTRRQLEGSSKRSLKYGLLKLGFRRIPPSIVITDDEQAVTWAEDHYPDAIKSTILKSRIPADAELGENSGMTRLEPEDRFYVD